MSVYHKWNTVFVQIPKNASTSIHSALSNRTDESHEHELYIETLSQNDPELIESYFSFAVVRNPYDRFVSMWEYLHGPEEYIWPLNFEETVNLFYERGRFFYTTENIHWWPQARFVAIKNAILVDEIIRIEEIDKRWPEIIDKIMEGVPAGFSKPSPMLGKSNQSPSREGRPWQEYYTPELKEKVYELYKRDFLLFNYEK
jgi:chondroitin 4-sulfotransferase 11